MMRSPAEWRTEFCAFSIAILPEGSATESDRWRTSSVKPYTSSLSSAWNRKQNEIWEWIWNSNLRLFLCFSFNTDIRDDRPRNRRFARLPADPRSRNDPLQFRQVSAFQRGMTDARHLLKWTTTKKISRSEKQHNQTSTFRLISRERERETRYLIRYASPLQSSPVISQGCARPQIHRPCVMSYFHSSLISLMPLIILLE